MHPLIKLHLPTETTFGLPASAFRPDADPSRVRTMRQSIESVRRQNFGLFLDGSLGKLERYDPTVEIPNDVQSRRSISLEMVEIHLGFVRLMCLANTYRDLFEDSIFSEISKMPAPCSVLVIATLHDTLGTLSKETPEMNEAVASSHKSTTFETLADVFAAINAVPGQLAEMIAAKSRRSDEADELCASIFGHLTSTQRLILAENPGSIQQAIAA